MTGLLLVAVFLLFWSAPADAWPIAAAIVAAIGITGTAATIATFVLAVGLTLGASALMSALFRPSPKQKVPDQQARQASVTSIQIGEVPRQAILGEAAIAGSLVDAFNHGGQYGTDWETLIIAVADHKCSGPTGVIVNDEFHAWPLSDVWNGQLRIDWCDGAENQTVPSDLATAWGADPADNLAGIAHFWVSYKADAPDANSPVWPAGRPHFLFVVKGKLCYDPRKDSTVSGGSGAHRWTDPATWEWTENLAVCRYNYARGIFACDRVTQPGQLLIGRGLSETDAPPARLFAHANLCDESVDKLGGGTEARYTVGGVVRADESFITVEQFFADACAGIITQPEGSVEVEPGAAKEPVFFFSDDDLVIGQPLQVTKFKSDAEQVNTVLPRYVEPAQRWSDHAAPVRRVLDDITADGGPREMTLALSLVNRNGQAQRVGEVARRLARLPIRANVTLPPRFARVEEGDWGGWTSNRHFDGEMVIFRVRAYGLNERFQNTLALEQITAEVFDFASGDYLTPQSTTLVPSGSPPPGNRVIQAPAGLALASGDDQLYTRLDGTIATRLRISWDEIEDPYVVFGGFVDLQMKLSADASYHGLPPVRGALTRAFVLDVQDGSYVDVQARCRDANGAVSGWATVAGHLVLGKLAPPSPVDSVTATGQPGGGVLVEWVYDDPPTDWANVNIYIDGVLVRSSVTGFSVVLTDAVIKPIGIYTIEVRPVDTSGNVGTGVSDTFEREGLPAVTTATATLLASGDVRLDWTYSVEPEDLASFSIYINGSLAHAAVAGYSVILTDAVLKPVGSYSIAVRAVDTWGNAGMPRTITYARTAPPPVNSLTATLLASGDALLEWTYASAPVDWVSIKVYIDGALAHEGVTGFSTVLADTVLKAVNVYRLEVRALDAAGNTGDGRVIFYERRPPTPVDSVSVARQADGSHIVSWVYTNPWVTSLNFDVLVDGQLTIDGVVGRSAGTPSVRLRTIGNHRISVVVVDVDGLRSQPTDTIYYRPPVPDVAKFNLNPVGSASFFSWDAVPAVDLDFYRIKYSPLLTGVSWSSAVDFVARVSAPATTLASAGLNGTYLIKAYDRDGNESLSAVLISTTLDGVAASNFIGQIDEAPAFAGVKQGCIVSDGKLFMDSDSVIADWGTLAEIEYLGTGITGFYPQGLYTFDQDYDLGEVQTCRVTAIIDAYGNNLADVISTWETLASVDKLDGSDSAKWRAQLQMRTTPDDPGGTPAWSDWTDFVIGDHTFRAAQFRLVLWSDRTTTTPMVQGLSITVDMEDRILSGNDVVCGTGGLPIVYDGAFRAAPSVGIAGQGMASGDYWTITSKSRTGFTIRFYNASNVAVERTFDWMAKGYGRTVA